MFAINQDRNTITKIESSSFSELNIKERYNLQEWLEDAPEAFGEELLIIQKEFDGFEDTRERLDLLALDKDGNLVIIENKLDDSGRDVTWQALKYASYCASLSKYQIKDIYQKYLDTKNNDEDSESNIIEFLNKEDFEDIKLNLNQRIIFVAGNFRKEVTSTVLWLLTKHNIRIQCFKAVPYKYREYNFLNIEQIIPVKEAEEYTIKMAEKAQEDQQDQESLRKLQKYRLKFWEQLLEKFKEKSDLYLNISPSKDSWLSTGSGVSRVGFNLVVSKVYARAEVYISRNAKDENKFIYDQLYNQQEKFNAQIENLQWQRLDSKKACRIKCELKGVSLYREEDWETMTEFMIKHIILMESVFKQPLLKINDELKVNFKS